MHHDRKIIAHVLPWAAIGGTELATLRIAEAVRSRGFQSIMFCRADNPAFVNFFAAHGFETVSYDVTQFEEGGIGGFIKLTLRLAGEFRRREVDIVHCAEVLGGDYAAVAAKLAGKRLICHVRNRYDWITRFQRLWLLTVDRLVFVSRHTKDNFGRLARQFGSVADRTGVVVYDGFTAARPSSGSSTDAEARAVLAEFGIPSEARVVGMVARLAAQKDHETLIEAAGKVVEVHSDVYFLLVGGCGTEPRELEHKKRVLQQISESKARDRIVYAGFRSDVPGVLQAIDVFVLSTHFEGLPLVILEAMAYGKPVVATAVDGIPEVVIDGKTGLLHRHQDSEHLASQLLFLLADNDLSQAFGKAGREFVDQHFSSARFADVMTCLYQDVLRIDRRADRTAALRPTDQ